MMDYFTAVLGLLVLIALMLAPYASDRSSKPMVDPDHFPVAKAFWAGLVAIILGVVAWIVGKRTPHLYAARLRSNYAQRKRLQTTLGKMLQAQAKRDAAAKAAKKAAAEALRTRAEIDALDLEAIDLGKKLLEVKSKSDPEFAHFFNRTHPRVRRTPHNPL